MLIDPDDLRVNVKNSPLVSSARLTIQQSCNGPTYLYTVNATDSLRYQITGTDFIIDPAWTRTYLVPESGSTVASSPLLYGRIGQVAFADNTAPGADSPIHLFVQPVDVNDLPPESTPLTAIPAFSDHDEPGFNFFMVAGDPFSRQILVYYDPTTLPDPEALRCAKRLLPLRTPPSTKVTVFGWASCMLLPSI